MGACPAIPDAAKLELLSQRERTMLRLVALGLYDREIGERLKREPSTVKTHLRRIGRKLGVGRRAVLVRFAVRVGLVEV